MNKFLEYLSKNKEFLSMDEDLNNKKTPILLNGISSNTIPFFANYIQKNQNKKVIYITPSDITAQEVYKELKKYSEKTIILQNDELKFYQIDATNRENEFSRISVLRKIYDEDYDFLVLTVSVLMRKYMPKHYYEENMINIDSSDKLDIYELSNNLIHLGYERVKKVEGKGQFSLRGSILDIFTPDIANPVRREFF
ncbi:MAG: transcription-repair coupling factor, partial [Peptostreptococcaceae bacterium]|nr:transcription-repair coupling factor [Peptostreptococcaceae bacterium]